MINNGDIKTMCSSQKILEKEKKGLKKWFSYILFHYKKYKRKYNIIKINLKFVYFLII